ncbi:MAG: Gfo/Idh/MocA family protein [Pirellulaceae bacterium]
MRLRVGVVGLGTAWQLRHRAALLALGDRFDVRAVCAEVAARAEQVAMEFGACAVDGFRALTSRDDIDAVLVLTAEWYGPLPILSACESGKAVYCAAALDIDPRRASEVRERVEKSGVAFMAELPRRHSPATLRLKELIATTLGEPRLLFCHERQKQGESNGCAPQRHRCPTAVRDLLELVDWCRYVVGKEPTSVMGVCHEQGEVSVDYQMMSLDFTSPDKPLGTGTLAQISCSRYLRSNWPEAVAFRPPAELQVCCERGVAFVDLPSTLVWFDEAGRHQESLGSERPVGEQLLMQFHRAVTSLVRKTGDLEDAYRALHVVLAAQESGRTGHRVGLNP